MNAEFFKDLFNLQRDLAKVTLAKDNKNPFFKSKYVDLNQVLEVIMPILQQHNMVLIQAPDMMDGKSVLSTRIVHTSGHQIEGISELLVKDNDPQKMGSAITYMRRYSLIAMFNLRAEDDDANDAAGKKSVHTSGKQLAQDGTDQAHYELSKGLSDCRDLTRLEMFWKGSETQKKLSYLCQNSLSLYNDIMNLKIEVKARLS